jgi:hypothetical protein
VSDTDDQRTRLLDGLRKIRKIARQRRSMTQDAARADSFASIYWIARRLIEELEEEARP